MSLKEIKDHWNQKAQEFIQNLNNEMGNTLYDENLRRLEINAIQKYLLPETNVLDVGCGNGFSTIQFAKNNDIHIDGMDYADEMIKNARSLLDAYPSLTSRVNFFIGDILKPESITRKYDIIITERCLINLESWENQKQALIKIKDMLNDNGRFIMLEGFKDNLDKLNEVRKQLKLEPIKVVWHNLFFEKEKFESFIKNYFRIEAIDNYGSMYMLISRSLFHILFNNQFDRTIDYLATLLPNLGDYNYQQLYVLFKNE